MAVAAVAAGILAGAGNAAPTTVVGKALWLQNAPGLQKKSEQFKQPTLENGLLTVKGTNADDRIALRLRAGQPGILEVDVGDDGSAEFSFERTEIAQIVVDAGDGGDGGADIVTVNDLTGTDVEEFNLDLQAVSAVATAESTA